MALNKQTCASAAYQAVKAIGNGTSEADAQSRVEALIGAIFDHIASNATIAPLSTDGGTTAGDPPHKHNPSTTSATGKIS